MYQFNLGNINVQPRILGGSTTIPRKKTFNISFAFNFDS